MPRWQICVAASVLACTAQNPAFLATSEGVAGSSSSATTTTGAEPPASSTAATSTTSAGETTTTTSTTTSTSTTAMATTSEGSGPESTGTSSEGSSTGAATCADMCGTPNCGTCPGGKMIAFPNFKIDALEVTNADYEGFLGVNYDPAAQTDACAWNTDFHPTPWPPAGEDGLPVVGVDWCDAFTFCAWAGKRLCGAIGGEHSAYLADVVDAGKNQWYAACTGEQNWPYPYGAVYDKTACNGADAGQNKLVPTGSMEACEGSLPGLFDISGNVWEWVDSCEKYAGASDVCLRRGGSRFSGSDLLSCNAWGDDTRDAHDAWIGFRCCRG